MPQTPSPTERSPCSKQREGLDRPEPITTTRRTAPRRPTQRHPHTLDLGLEAADDEELLQLATSEQRVVASGDTDFGTRPATTNLLAPPVTLFRGRHLRSAEEQAALILTHLDNLTPDLDAGAVVVITDDRIRRLPIG